MKNRVWPSGAAPVRSRSAGMKLPPARFSTKTVVRRFSLIFCATSRAMTSVAPPAASPTIILIGLPEKSCAFAERIGAQASATPAAKAKADRSCMCSSLLGCGGRFLGRIPLGSTQNGCRALGVLPSPLWGGAGGGGRNYCAENVLQHTIDIRQHIVVPISQDAVAIRFKYLRAFFVGC